MGNIKIRVMFNKGKHGIKLSRLSALSGEVFRLLDLLAADVGIDTDPNKWVAINFSESSLAYDNQYLGDIADEFKINYNQQFKELISSPADKVSANGYGVETVDQYIKIANATEVGESIRFGVYGNGEVDPGEWIEFDKQEAMKVEIFKSQASQVIYEGGVQGFVHSLHKEPPNSGELPWVKIREISTNRLINCYYKNSQYSEVVSLLEPKDAVVFVSGKMRATLPDQKLEMIEARKFDKAPPYDSEDFEKFFGCAPGLAGDMSAAEYIRKARDNGENA